MSKDTNTNLRSILVHKSLDLAFTYCNRGFLKYSGLSSEEEALGLTDYDLPWGKYADLYHKHELDALSGKQYSTLVPLKDCKDKEYVFLNTKTPKKDKKGNIIGTISYAIELINPPIFEFVHLLQNSIIHAQNFFSMQEGFLSNRESECLFYLLRGKSAKQIGHFLGLSPKTVEHYIENIKSKFQCQTKSELISKAVEQGYINVIPKNILFEKLSSLKQKMQA